MEAKHNKWFCGNTMSETSTQWMKIQYIIVFIQLGVRSDTMCFVTVELSSVCHWGGLKYFRVMLVTAGQQIKVCKKTFIFSIILWYIYLICAIGFIQSKKPRTCTISPIRVKCIPKVSLTNILRYKKDSKKWYDNTNLYSLSIFDNN